MKTFDVYCYYVLRKPTINAMFDFVFQSLRRMGQDHLILMLCVTVFLSYLPEAGEYSCFFVYLKLVSNYCILILVIIK